MTIFLRSLTSKTSSGSYIKINPGVEEEDLRHKTYHLRWGLAIQASNYYDRTCSFSIQYSGTAKAHIPHDYIWKSPTKFSVCRVSNALSLRIHIKEVPQSPKRERAARYQTACAPNLTSLYE